MTPSRFTFRRTVSAAVVLMVCLAGIALTATVSQAVSAGRSTSFTKTVTVTRDNLNSGKNDVVDKRRVTLR